MAAVRSELTRHRDEMIRELCTSSRGPRPDADIRIARANKGVRPDLHLEKFTIRSTYVSYVSWGGGVRYKTPPVKRTCTKETYAPYGGRVTVRTLEVCVTNVCCFILFVCLIAADVCNIR